MKITIDTKEDSPSDIRKIIALLSKMTEGDSGHSRNIFEDDTPILGSSEPSEPSSSSEPSGTNAFANMFGSDSPAPSVTSEETEEEIEDPEEEVAELIEY